MRALLMMLSMPFAAARGAPVDLSLEAGASLPQSEICTAKRCPPAPQLALRLGLSPLSNQHREYDVEIGQTHGSPLLLAQLALGLRAGSTRLKAGIEGRLTTGFAPPGKATPT